MSSQKNPISSLHTTNLLSLTPTIKKVAAATSASPPHHTAPAMGSTAEEQSTIVSSISDDGQQHQHFAYAMQLVTSSVLPMTLQAAFELGLFEILAKAGNGAELSPTEITAKLTTSNPDAASMIDRILRLLAAHSVVGCSVIIDENGNQQRLYSLTPVAKYFLLDEDGVSLGALLSMIQDKVFLESWFALFFTFSFLLIDDIL